jgi:signal transduction histidine kinase
VAFLATMVDRVRLRFRGRDGDREQEMARELEAMYRLAGSVAHDLNNAVGVILGYGALMRRSLSDDERQQRRLGEILSAADRAAALTRELQAFGQKAV